MQPINKLKIVMIGPSKSGKTALANLVSGTARAEEAGAGNETTRPTRGARIVEFELSNLDAPGTNKVDIELWDCSGDHQYEACWPAVRAGSHGVVLVCAPHAAGAARELDLLYNYFLVQRKLSPRQCVVMYNVGERPDDVAGLTLSATFAKVSQVPVNLVSGGNRLKVDFSNYITSVIQALS